MKDQTALFRSTLLLTAVNLLGQVTGLLCRMGIARLAGAEVMGVYQLLLPAASVLSALVISGVAVAVSALTGELLGRGEYRGIRRLTGLALGSLTILWLLAALPTALFSDFLSAAFLGDARTRLGLLLLLPCLLLTGFEAVQKHLFYGLGRVRLPAAVELGEQGVRTGAILLLLWAFPGLSTEEKAALIVGGMLCSELFSALCLSVGTSRLALPRRGRRTALGRALWEKAAPIGGAALIASALSAVTAVLAPDRLIAAGVPAEEATEVYGVLFGMSLPLLALPACFVGALCTLLLPRLSRWQAQGDLNRCRQTLGTALDTVSRLLFPLLALLAVLGGDLGSLLFHESRVGEGLPVLALAVAFSGWDSLLSSALNALGCQRENAAAGIAAGLAELALTWFLTGSFGVTGCCLSLLIASAGETALRFLLCRRRLSLPWGALGSAVAPIAAVVLTALCTRLLRLSLLAQGFSPLPRTAICAGFGAGFYLLTLWVTAIKQK